MDSPLTFPADRLIEYWALCGPGDELLPAGDEGPGWYRTPTGRVHPTRATFAPRLLDRYPLVDHPDTPLPTGVADFCFPLLVRLARKAEPLPSAFTFITTSGKGERLHGYCLTFWEELSASQAACVDPALPPPPQSPPPAPAAVDKARGAGGDVCHVEAMMTPVAAGPESPPSATLSRHTTAGTMASVVELAQGLADDDDDGDGYDGEATGGGGGSSSSSSSSSTSSSSSSSSSEEVVGDQAALRPPPPLRSAPAAATAAPLQSAAPPSSSAPRLFAPKCFCLLSRWAFPAFRTLLSELYRMSLTPQAVPLERTLVNLCAEVALPPAGRVEVLYPLGSTTLVFKRPPKNRRVSALNLPMREVLEALEPGRLIALVTAVLLDRQVLLVSSQLSLLTAAADVVCALIYPFRFAHTVIPVLPLGLTEVLGAPTPYLLGLHVDAWRVVAAEVPPGVIQVDLDRNRVWVTPETALNSLAGPRRSTRGGGGGDGGGGRRGSDGGDASGVDDEAALGSARSTGSGTGVPGPSLDEALPRLPDKQRRKLMRSLAQHADVFARRPSDWIYSRLPTLDSAFSFASRPDELPDDGGGGYGGVAGGEGTSDEGALVDPDTDDDERGPASSVAAPGRIQHSVSGGRAGGHHQHHADATAASFLDAPLVHRVNWGATRRGFFRVFVSLLLRYRDHLAYPTPENPFPRSRFHKEAFLREAAPEARRFLGALLETQAFADFIDDRVQPSPSCEVDVTFFDEQCDAKSNRSVWTLPKKDTPFLASAEFAITKSVMALSPDATALPPPPLHPGAGGGGGFVYSPWPVPCDARLFCTPREIPSYADKLSSSGRFPFHALRRSGAHFTALQRFAVASIANSSAGGSAQQHHRAAGGSAGAAAHDATAAAASRWSSSSSSSSTAAGTRHASGAGGGSGTLSPEAHVYHAWMLAFTCALDVITSHVERRAGQEFDARELAAAAATQASHLAALREAAGPPGSPGQLKTLTQSGAVALVAAPDAAVSLRSPSPGAASYRSGGGSAVGAGSGGTIRAGSVAAATRGAPTSCASSSAAGTLAAPAKPARSGSVAAALSAGGGGGSGGSAASHSSGGEPPRTSASSLSSSLSLSGASPWSPPTVTVVAAPPQFALPPELAPSAASLTPGAGQLAAPRAQVPSLRLAGGLGGSGVSGHRRQPTMKRRELALRDAKAAFFASQTELAFDVYGRMRAEGHAPDELIFTLLLELCGRSADYARARWLVQDLVGQGFEHDAGLHRLLFSAFYASNPDALTAAGAHSLPSLSSSFAPPTTHWQRDNPGGGGGGGGGSRSPQPASPAAGAAAHAATALMAPATSPGGAGAPPPPAAGAGAASSLEAPLHTVSSFSARAQHAHGVSAFAAPGGHHASESRRDRPKAARVPCYTSYVIDGDSPLHAGRDVTCAGDAVASGGCSGSGSAGSSSAGSSAAPRAQPAAARASVPAAPTAALPTAAGSAVRPGSRPTGLPPLAPAALSTAAAQPASAHAAPPAAPALTTSWYRMFGRRGSNASDTGAARPSPRAGSAAAATSAAGGGGSSSQQHPRSRSASGAEGAATAAPRLRGVSGVSEADSVVVYHANSPETRDALAHHHHHHAAAAAAPQRSAPAGAASGQPPRAGSASDHASGSSLELLPADTAAMRFSAFMKDAGHEPATHSLSSADASSLPASADAAPLPVTSPPPGPDAPAAASAARLSCEPEEEEAGGQSTTSRSVAGSAGCSGESQLTGASELPSPALHLHHHGGSGGDGGGGGGAADHHGGGGVTGAALVAAPVVTAPLMAAAAELEAADAALFVGIDDAGAAAAAAAIAVNDTGADTSAGGGERGVPAGPPAADAIVAASQRRVFSSSARPAPGLAAVTIHSTIVDRPPTEAVVPRVCLTRQLGAARLTARFPDLLIDTLRETCPACERPLTDADVRAGWANDEHSYVTVCPYCPLPRGGGGGGGGGPPPQRAGFVARFSVTSSSPVWRGSSGVGAGAPLFCEHLPPAVLVKELQHAVAHGQVGPHLRVRSPTLFWNLLLWTVQLGLPAEFTSFLAVDVDERGEGQPSGGSWTQTDTPEGGAAQ